jgi:hypothetical protein
VRFAGIASLDPVAKVVFSPVHYDGGVVYSIDLWSLVPDQSGKQSMAVSPGSREMP